jgi:hypothetical protein
MVAVLSTLLLTVGCSYNSAHKYCLSQRGYCGKYMCEKAQGEWSIAGLSGKGICDVRADDYGKTCADNNECQSRECAAPAKFDPNAPVVGTCGKSATYFFGCSGPTVRNGKVDNISLCVD